MTLDDIAGLLKTGEGRLEATQVLEICAQERVTAEELAVQLLPLARMLARPLISKYPVGAVVLGASGALYLGANIEIPGNVLGMTVHAEQAAACNACMSGDTGIAAIAVSAAPCGHCRQFLHEFADGRDIRILEKNRPPILLSSLLPHPFGPKDLGRSDGPFTRTPYVMTLDAPDELATAALDAAKRSYAPYSGSPAGVAVKTRSGRIYQGTYLENAAFNPSLSPLQVALVRIAAAGEAFADIVIVKLVELKNAAISQRGATRAVLEAISPNASLEVLLCGP